MHFATTAFAAAGLAAHQALAFGPGGYWGESAQYSTPDNTNNDCSASQAQGYDWSGLSTGSFGEYGSNTFSGWSCANSFGRRDLLSKRGFQSKCITAPLDNQPSIGCHDDNTMSLDHFQVTSNKDVNIDCVYDMPGGGQCTETHSCSAGGSTIQNTQCGGAKSVTFKPSNGDSGCTIGVHSIGFNCGPASSAPPSPSSTASLSSPSHSAPPYGGWSSSPASSAPAYSSPSESAPGHSASSAPHYSVPTSSVESSPVPQSSASAPSAPPYGGSSSAPSSSATPTSSPSAPAYSASSIPASSEVSAVTQSTFSIPSAPAYGSHSSATSSALPSSHETSPVATSSSSSIPQAPPYGGTSSSAPSAPAYGGSSSSQESSPVKPSTSSAPSAPVYGHSSTFSNTSTSTTTTSSSIPAETGSSAPLYSYAGSSSPASSSATSAVSTVTQPTAPAYGGSSSSPVSPVTGPSAPAYGGSSSSEVAATTASSAPAYGTSSSAEVSAAGSSSITSFSTSTIYTTSVETISSCTESGMNCATSNGSPAVVTHTVAVSTTVCPVTQAEATAAPSSAAPSYSYSPQSPNSLPKCLSTWMYLTKCSGNTDYDCFCKDQDFITKVMGCISAWSSSSDETSGAASYLMGMCAPYVSQNPAIITACPSTVTPVASYSFAPPPSSASAAPAQTSAAPAPASAASAPCTTLTYSTAYPVPATYSTGVSSGATIPLSSITTTILTTVTVPQVQIITSTLTSGSSIVTKPALGYGSPPTATPVGSPAPPAPSVYQTTNAVGAVGGTPSSSFGTMYATHPPSASNTITPYTGAGVRLSSSGFVAMALGAVAFLM